MQRLLLIALAALTFTTAESTAHAHLKVSSPAAEATVPVAPTEVTITFTEALEGNLSRISIKDGAGTPVDGGDTHVVAGGDNKTLAVSVKGLAAGTYRVDWSAASVDTHKTTGSFQFTIKP